MCVICVKEKGVAFPKIEVFEKMWNHNPHGAGFMYARNGKVHIRKGFMDLYSFLKAIQNENITDDEACVMHFRISTQAGISKEMTHPFPLSDNLEHMEKLSLGCNIGIAHNGIIMLTSNPLEKRYSDTAIFVANYLTRIIRNPNDIHDAYIKDIIFRLAQSKLAIMNGNGDIEMIGAFEKQGELYFSNLYHEPSKFAFYERTRYGNYYKQKCKSR